MTTGLAHWELNAEKQVWAEFWCACVCVCMFWVILLHCRALDYQMFVGRVNVARDTSASYVAWGHSVLINPWSVY